MTSCSISNVTTYNYQAPSQEATLEKISSTKSDGRMEQSLEQKRMKKDFNALAQELSASRSMSFEQFSQVASKDPRFRGGNRGKALYREYFLEEDKKRKLQEAAEARKRQKKNEKMLEVEDILEQPLEEQLKESRELPLPLEELLKKKLVGQELAIEAVASAVMVRDSGWEREDKPLVLLFLGPSGVGKTELAKQVSEYLQKDKKSTFVRIDMSEYREKHDVSKMIGSPPGYVGHSAGGQLTTKLRENPEAVVLFDEVDKAHPDVLTVLLQLFDEGRLTDGQGKTIECRKAIFIMTSNLASKEITDLRQTGDEGVTEEFKEEIVQPILKSHFQRDEFIGRITEIVYFLPFSTSQVHQLLQKELEDLKERGKKKHGVELEWGDEVVEFLSAGYNLKHGARSIQNVVQKKVTSTLQKLGKQVDGNIRLSVDSDNQSIVAGRDW